MNINTDNDVNLDMKILKYFKENIKIRKSIKNKELIDRYNIIKEYRDILDELKKQPLIKQRTPEWFELRKTRLTASDLGDAIGTESNKLRLAKKKAGVYIDDTNYNNIPSLKWGTMFEDMASRCYSQKNNNIKINEFGLIPDKNLEHFGASPDGITELGIMIEIKCPYSREIKDKYIPPKYYLQIQGQLAVCNLKECDYVECKFYDYDNIDDYIDDKEINNTLKINHGVIAEFKNNEGEYYYIYSDENLTKKEAIKNIIEKKELEDNNINFIKFTYWKLSKMLIQKVNFNKNDWETIIPKINSFWDKVEECKKLPIEYKRVKYKFIDDNDNNNDNDNDIDDNINNINNINNIVNIINDNDTDTDDNILDNNINKIVNDKIKYLFINDD